MNAAVEKEPISAEVIPAKPPARSRMPVVSDSSPSGMLAYAMRTGGTIDQIERLYALQQKWEADEAKKDFVRAMAAFKANPPVIVNDKKNTQFNSTYSSLANTVNKTNERLAEFGLNATWNVEQIDGGKLINVTCILTHERGHSERVSQAAPPDESGSRKDGTGSVKNPIQQIKSTITYLRGITFELVTGVVTGQQGINLDDDGNGAGKRRPAAPEPEESPALKKLVADLYSVADEGIEPLQKAWTDLGAEKRKQVGSFRFGQIKARAEKREASAPQ